MSDGPATGAEQAGALVHLGLGSNLGERGRNLRQALEQLLTSISIDAVSHVYETEPVGFSDQPEFWNLVVRARTTLDPQSLFRRTKQIEVELGRQPTFPNGPRVIDIDLLSYDDLVWHSQELDLPHPRLHERTFVLYPLRDVSPGFRHPESGRTPSEMLDALTEKTRAIALNLDVLEEHE